MRMSLSHFMYVPDLLQFGFQFTPAHTVVSSSLIRLSSQETIHHRFITLTVLDDRVKFSILLLLLRIIEVSCINHSKRPAVSLCIYFHTCAFPHITSYFISRDKISGNLDEPTSTKTTPTL